jgi:hypothetical protein
MNLRKNKGITMVALVITIIILLILAGISVTGVIRGIDETNESTQISQLEMVQHALLERKTKADLTKEKLETLPGTTADYTELQNLINEINTMSSANITLRGNKEDYKELSTADLKELGIEKETNTFIVNYKTGEVINKTQKVTKAGRALYTYAK